MGELELIGRYELIGRRLDIAPGWRLDRRSSNDAGSGVLIGTFERAEDVAVRGAGWSVYTFSTSWIWW